MNYWIITDTHFGHEKIVTSGYRPVGFERQILKGIESTVQEDDILLHLGDVVFKQAGYWMERFFRSTSARKWLVRGNHDRSVGWNLSHGFDFVAEAISMEYLGVKILFSHEPQAHLGDHDINIHGHLHEGNHHAAENLPNTPRHVCLYMEGRYRQPWLLKSIVSDYQRRRPKC